MKPDKCRVLDIGCGLKPRGDVNVDLYLDSIHRRGGKGPKLRPEDIPEFLEADALESNLFSYRQFGTVTCYHMMEHIPFPDCWLLLRNLWKWTNHHLVVEVPSRYWLKFPSLKRSPVHVSNWDLQTLEKAVPLVLGTRNFDIRYIYRGLFHKMIPFPLWPRFVHLDVWRDD